MAFPSTMPGCSARMPTAFLPHQLHLIGQPSVSSGSACRRPSQQPPHHCSRGSAQDDHAALGRRLNAWRVFAAHRRMGIGAFPHPWADRSSYFCCYSPYRLNLQGTRPSPRLIRALHARGGLVHVLLDLSQEADGTNSSRRMGSGKRRRPRLGSTISSSRSSAPPRLNARRTPQTSRITASRTKCDQKSRSEENATRNDDPVSGQMSRAEEP
jgi:hypothetical protein